MRDLFSLTNYQMRYIRFYSAAALALFVSVIIIANLIYLVFGKSVTVSSDAYIMKDGFPLFVSSKDYISFVKSYHRNPGVKLRFHKSSHGESVWSISQSYGVSVDTIISANPFLKSFSLSDGTELVLPMENGVLFPYQRFYQVWRMAGRLEFEDEVKGDGGPSLIRLYTKDDMRLAFFPGKRPILVSENMEKLYRIKNLFQTPTVGKYSSMFGDRVDPMYHEMGFHNGIDIYNRIGTPIRPVKEGIVSYKGWRDGYGLTVALMHAGGYSSLYGHCSKVNVEVGEFVGKNDIIGLMGSTGRSTGSHLHFTVYRHGRLINPIFFVW
jgi:murein DD-endopeptidase MepM/ murein hydrolase activator NlpD